MKNIFVLMLNFIFTIALIAQQQYPNLWNVGINASCKTDISTGLFYFKYSLTNISSNMGDISRFEIDISRSSTSFDIDTIGLQFENDGYAEKNFRRNYPHLKGRIIPVGVFKTPIGKWTGGLTNDLTARFSGIGEDHVRPGNSISGFELVSKGLSSIRSCIVSPYFDVIGLFPDPGDTTVTYYVPPVDSVRNAVKFNGWTIGPTAPPINFIATIWCDTLTSYTTQSRTLGWIKDDVTANKYSSYFTSAKTSLQDGDSSAASKTLQKILMDVKVDSISNPAAQTTGKLTSEAYALLRYNTEYLLAKLPQQTAFTVAELLDSLRARLQQFFVQNQIGDKNFVNELDNGLTNAQKHLSKGDSVNCRKEVIKFQDKLQKEYEKKPKDKRFVTEEGYRLLNDRAQAIINRLPVKK